MSISSTRRLLKTLGKGYDQKIKDWRDSLATKISAVRNKIKITVRKLTITLLYRSAVVTSYLCQLVRCTFLMRSRVILSQNRTHFSFSPITSDDEDSDDKGSDDEDSVLHSDLEEEDSEKEKEAIMELGSLENHSQ